MSFWETVLSGFIAAVAAGLILGLIRRVRRRRKVGTVSLDDVDLVRSAIDTEVSEHRPESDDSEVGTVEISKSQVVDSPIKTKVSGP